jgi:hypothetical protein
MKNECAKWKDQLLETALTGVAASSLREHMLTCHDCTAELAELRAKRERMDILLARVAQGAEPSVEFRTRVLAATDAAGETAHGPWWQEWQRAGAMAAIVVVTLVIGFTMYRREARTVPRSELEAAQKLSEWRAPSDVLLETAGREILRTTPRLGESYLRVPAKTEKEE